MGSLPQRKIGHTRRGWSVRCAALALPVHLVGYTSVSFLSVHGHQRFRHFPPYTTDVSTCAHGRYFAEQAPLHLCPVQSQAQLRHTVELERAIPAYAEPDGYGCVRGVARSASAVSGG